jgi:hypothetical protein
MKPLMEIEVRVPGDLVEAIAVIESCGRRINAAFGLPAGMTPWWEAGLTSYERALSVVEAQERLLVKLAERLGLPH